MLSSTGGLPEDGLVLLLCSSNNEFGVIAKRATAAFTESRGWSLEIGASFAEVEPHLRHASLVVVDVSSVNIETRTSRGPCCIPDPDRLIAAGLAIGMLGRQRVVAIADASKRGEATVHALDVIEIADSGKGLEKELNSLAEQLIDFATDETTD